MLSIELKMKHVVAAVKDIEIKETWNIITLIKSLQF